MTNKNYRKKYEFMVNGFSEFLKDLEQWRYVRLERSMHLATTLIE